MPRCVTQVTLHGQVIYPEELPCARGNMTTNSTLIFLAIICSMCFSDIWQTTKVNFSFVVCLVCCFNLAIVSEMAIRLLHFTEEIKHLKSRHKGSKWNLIKKLLLNFTSSALFFILGSVCSLMCILLLGYDVEYHVHTLPLWQMCAILIITILIMDLVKLRKNPVHDSVFLEALKGLDYGSGMAQSFFYGYLRLCIPNTGDQEKGLAERIDDFISKEKIPEKLFPVKKMFILIPSSTYIVNDLKDCSDGWMLPIDPLEIVVKDRAGCKERHYKCSVYKIKNPDDDSDDGVYVVAEGATPCKTLNEVVQFSGVQQDFYKEHQNEIVFNFYQTLRKTLWDNMDCRDLCEIIYYVDTDEYGNIKVNVAKLILQRIKEIEEKEDYLKHVRDRNIQ